MRTQIRCLVLWLFFLFSHLALAGEVLLVINYHIEAGDLHSRNLRKQKDEFTERFGAEKIRYVEASTAEALNQALKQALLPEDQISALYFSSHGTHRAFYIPDNSNAEKIAAIAMFLSPASGDEGEGLKIFLTNSESESAKGFVEINEESARHAFAPIQGRFTKNPGLVIGSCNIFTNDAGVAKVQSDALRRVFGIPVEAKGFVYANVTSGMDFAASMSAIFNPLELFRTTNSLKQYALIQAGAIYLVGTPILSVATQEYNLLAPYVLALGYLGREVYKSNRGFFVDYTLPENPRAVRMRAHEALNALSCESAFST